MVDIHLFLANVWFLLLGLILMFYVVTDGFDLGVGILSLFERDNDRRTQMMTGLKGIWDANETWLILFGGALFGAFPAVYALVLQALYIPITAILFGLILRGVAFEFRAHACSKRVWTLAFGGGSLLTTLAQGYALGGLIGGLSVADGQFTGTVWSWLSPFSTMVAMGVAAGYALLGGTYLIIKTQGKLQSINRKRSRWAAWIMLSAAAVVTIATPLLHSYITQRWFRAPDVLYLVPLPAIALGAFTMLMQSLRRGYEISPFVWSLVIFVASFVGLAVSLYPYLLPPALTLAATASSSVTLVFMLVGIGMLIPVMLVYNGYQYLVFRGKLVREEDENYA
jgi:cytochrome d ubiquinol oxidase subunit II